MIAVIDYGTGNLCSVANALKRIGAEYVVTSSAWQISSADRVLLPGVGEASNAMSKLSELGLVEVIRTLNQPVLGICIGLQLLCQHSEEENTQCIGVFENRVRKFSTPGLKVPHIGWNTIENLKTDLFTGVDPGAYIYYVHSYAPDINQDTIAQTTYGESFSGAIARGNFYGTQFHPEKSAAVGEQIIKNFLSL